MDALGVKQAEMARRTDWSKASTSQLYNGVQDYSPKIVNEAAAALNVEPFELLMPYERAMNMRRFMASAIAIAHSAEDDAPPEAKRA